jgi:alanine racemase
MGISIPLTHAVDSIGMVRYPADHLDGARIGAWLYGVCPRNAPVECLSPARFKARISQIRAVKKGELIGYDDDFPLERDSIVATLSAGYVDGTLRTGTNWQVEVRGMRAPVVGIACMDQLMIDVSDIPGVEEGDILTFMGGGISIEEYSDMGHFNRNEAWARIGRRVPRVYFENGKPVRVSAEL